MFGKVYVEVLKGRINGVTEELIGEHSFRSEPMCESNPYFEQLDEKARGKK